VDHNGRVFLDARRNDRAGESLGGKLAVCEYRADWLQYCVGFGFQHPNQINACFKCTCPREHLFTFDQTERWQDRSHQDFLAECAQCIVVVRLDRSDQELVKNLLKPDFREKRYERVCVEA